MAVIRAEDAKITYDMGRGRRGGGGVGGVGGVGS